MKRRCIGTIVAILSAVCVVFGLAGCSALSKFTGDAPSELTNPKLEPKVSNDHLVKADVLTIGLDYSYAPFAGETNGRVVGIDADMGAALGQQLGLNVEFVDVGTGGGPNAVASGQCDVFLNFLKDDATNSVAAYAGTYMYDAASLFVASSKGQPKDVKAKDAKGKRIAAQKGRATAELVSSLFGSTSLVEEESLANAFSDLEGGAVDYAAVSGVVGKYISLSYDDIYYAAALEKPHEIGAGVAADNKDMQKAVSDAISTMMSNGVTNVVISKWIGAPIDFGTVAADTKPADTKAKKK